MDRLVDLLKNSNHCVFLSGAGISTLSGIPDFRGEGGLYNKFNPDLIFSLDHFYKEPEYFYSNSRDFIYNLDEREPNLIHKVLSELEKRVLSNASSPRTSTCSTRRQVQRMS